MALNPLAVSVPSPQSRYVTAPGHVSYFRYFVPLQPNITDQRETAPLQPRTPDPTASPPSPRTSCVTIHARSPRPSAIAFAAGSHRFQRPQAGKCHRIIHLTAKYGRVNVCRWRLPSGAFCSQQRARSYPWLLRHWLADAGCWRVGGCGWKSSRAGCPLVAVERDRPADAGTFFRRLVEHCPPQVVGVWPIGASESRKYEPWN